MEAIFYSYKFRLYPSKDQQILLGNIFGCCRFVYNHFLFQHKKKSENKEKPSSYFQNCSALTQMKKDNQYLFLKDVIAESLQFSLKSLEKAFLSFYKNQNQYPVFKSKKDKQSFSCRQDIHLQKNRIFIPKFKTGIIIHLHRPIEGVIQKISVTKTSTLKYFVSILVKRVIQPKEKSTLTCGIDLGIKSLAVISDGTIFSNNKYLQKYELKLKAAQRHLSKKVKNSRSFLQQKRKIALINEKITNSRNDYLNKISTKIINQYDVICLEDLNTKGLIKNHCLSKAISDVSWYLFFSMLEYKARFYGKKIIKINRFYPSSKTCSICGSIKPNLALSERYWICSNDHFLDRDLNAANNILQQGLKIYRQELAITSIQN